ncbi:MAG TPA: hypothetical protein DCY07_02855 [Rhodospirillaceae bacterium]|nr:hypothetical protein [Rhodospirillaceae bacterium]
MKYIKLALVALLLSTAMTAPVFAKDSDRYDRYENSRDRGGDDNIRWNDGSRDNDRRGGDDNIRWNDDRRDDDRRDGRRDDDRQYSSRDGDWRHNQRVIVMKFDNDRANHIRTYMHKHYRNYCPPGLAKKHNRCKPPGHAKRRYEVGGYVPLYHYEVPYNLLNEVGPPPRGTYYTMVDRDVLLVSEATKKILDAVVLFSAVQ